MSDNVFNLPVVRLGVQPLICGVVKNAGKYLDNNINLLLQTGLKFKDYKIIIYENNSTDNTKDILNKYINDEHFVIISEDISDIHLKENNEIWSYTEITGKDHPCRIELISNARNKLIDEVNKQQYCDYSHVIMIDLDSKGWSIDGILDSFSRKDDWDAIFANSDKYYDYYALRWVEYPFGPEILGDHFWKQKYTHSFSGTSDCMNDVQPLIPVYSAFNGIGIYKRFLFINHRYDFKVNTNVKHFYTEFIKTHLISETLQNCFETPCHKFPHGLKEKNVFWKSNSGYNGLVVCEHVALNLSLYNDKFKLFINPNMKYNWSG